MMFEFDLDEELNVIEVRSSERNMYVPMNIYFPEGRMFTKMGGAFRESCVPKTAGRSEFHDFPWWSERLELTAKQYATTNEVMFGVEASDELEAFVKLQAWLEANGG